MLTTIAVPRARSFAIALAAALLGGGCAPATQAPRGDVLVASAGASMAATAPMAPAHTAYTEAHTASFALDRIDQRALPLDGTYRHYGTGHNVTVYVFDGGIMNSHPELEGRYRKGFDAFPDDAICNPHGTAVAGAIAGTTLGVAPDAEIVDVKMIDCRRMRGSIDAIVRGADWVIADHKLHPHHRAVANWSFIADTSGSIPALDSAVNRLMDAGIPVVVSAGNIEMDACHISPSNSPGVITVGSSRVKLGAAGKGVLVDERTPGTAYGSCVSIFAPGDSVLLPSMDTRHMPNEQLWTGTSMAAGYVSGAAALYLESHFTATAEEVVSYLTRNASRAAVLDPRSASAGMLYVGPGDTPARTLAAAH